MEVIRFGKVAASPWRLEGDERYERAAELKQRGNEGIKEQRYQDAVNSYEGGERLVGKDYTFREEELSGQLRSNLSLAYLKNKQYEKCVGEASKVLEKNAENVKILHRRAVALIELEDYDRAR